MKCILCIGLAITRPRETGMHNLPVRTAATDANWATAQKLIIAFEESNQHV